MENKPKTRKPKYGYRASECRPTSVRSLWIDVYTIDEFDVGKAILAAVQAGDEKRIARFSKLAAQAQGRTIYVKTSQATITYQGDPSIENWYAPALNMATYGGSSAARKVIFKSFEASEFGLTPAALVDALGAIRLDTIRDENNDPAHVGTEYAMIHNSDHDKALDDPYPKVAEVA